MTQVDEVQVWTLCLSFNFTRILRIGLERIFAVELSEYQVSGASTCRRTVVVGSRG